MSRSNVMEEFELETIKLVKDSVRLSLASDENSLKWIMPIHKVIFEIFAVLDSKDDDSKKKKDSSTAINKIYRIISVANNKCPYGNFNDLINNLIYPVSGMLDKIGLEKINGLRKKNRKFDKFMRDVALYDNRKVPYFTAFSVKLTAFLSGWKNITNLPEQVPKQGIIARMLGKTQPPSFLESAKVHMELFGQMFGTLAIIEKALNELIVELDELD